MSQLPSILKEIKSMILRARNLILRGPRKPPARLSQRARRARLLPALALLLGALSLFAAAPAQAQTVTLSVSRTSVPEGSSVSVTACLKDGNGSRAVPTGTVHIPVVLSHGTSESGDWGKSLSGHTDGSLPIRTTHSIAISGYHQRSCGLVNIPTHEDIDEDDDTFTVALDTANLPSGVTAGTPSSVTVTITESEKAREEDQVRYTPDDVPPQVTQQGKVSLSVSRTSVPEGSSVSVTACLKDGNGSRAVPTGTVHIPVVLSHGTSESGDWGKSLSGHTDGSLPIRTTHSITISGYHQKSCGLINIPTHEDSDGDDETFTVALGALPAALTAGTPSSVTVTITDTDDDQQPEAANAPLGPEPPPQDGSPVPSDQVPPPVQAPGEAPGQGPSEAPGEAPGQGPGEAPGEAPGQGPGEAPDEPNTAPPAGVPGAPVNLTATPGDGKLVVRWQEPAQNGGFDLAYYQLQYQQTTRTTWQTVALRIPASHSSKTYTLSSLPNGVAHNVRVRVFNRNPDSALAHSAWATTTATPAAAAKQVAGGPASFELAAAYPNPFNPTTTIRYGLPQAVEVELTVYNIAGQPVQTLVAEHQRTGWYAVEWDASGLAAGLYFYRLQAGEFRQVKKMLLLK